MNLRPNHPTLAYQTKEQRTPIDANEKGEMSMAMQAKHREHKAHTITADFRGKAPGHLWGKHPKH
jgi:hypothetical protein